MKKFLRIQLIVILIIALCPGCQPTPQESAIIGKSDGLAQDAVSDSASSALAYSAPDTWSETIEDGNVRYVFDAAISIPAAQGIPMYQIQPVPFDYSIFPSFFALQSPAYAMYVDEDDQMTKAEIAEIMETILTAIANADANYPALSEKELTAYIQGRQAEFEELAAAYQAAPETNLGQRVTDIESMMGEQWLTKIIGLDTASQKPIASLWLNVAPHDVKSYNLSKAWYTQISGSYNPFSGELQPRDEADKGFDPNAEAFEAALEMADYYLQALEIEGFVHSCTYFDTATKRINVIFTRAYHDVPISFANHTSNTITQDGDTTAYAQAWEPEYICIESDSKGIISFFWQSPSEVVREISRDVAILPFAEVQDICRRSLKYLLPFEPYTEGMLHRSVMITEMKLGLLCLREPNVPNTYYVTPVWDLYGYTIDQYESAAAAGGYILDENNTLRSGEMDGTFSLLTVNAIDGSIINRALGY